MMLCLKPSENHFKEPGGSLRGFLTCILAISPVTTNRLLGALLRWATSSDGNKQK